VKYAVLNRKDLGRWLEHLGKKARLYAPHKKENQFVFKRVTDVSKVTLNYIPTILPPKKYYFPQKEKLLKFTANPFKTAKAIDKFEKFILFGVHTCDIAGIQCMDVVFREYPEDPNYLNRKETMTIIGIECLKCCDKYANCGSMETYISRGGYDLMMIELNGDFILHVNSEKGEELINGLSYIRAARNEEVAALEKERKESKEIFKQEFTGDLKEVKKAFDGGFSSAVWQDVGRRCVACGNCTAVCPTCYCFDIIDQMELDLNEGLRYRMWNSCQMDDFAKVASGEDFRKGRDARQRHRYYRKFKYSMDKFKRFFCVGCGRCTRTCMAGISLTETVNSLLAESGKE